MPSGLSFESARIRHSRCALRLAAIWRCCAHPLPPLLQDSLGRSAIQLAAAHPTEAHGLTAAFTTMFLQHISQSEIAHTRRLLDAGIDVNGTDGGRQQNRPLHWACGYATPEMVGLLCRNGAEVNMTNADGGTPLHDAAIRGDQGIVRVLLDHGAGRGVRYTTGRMAGLAPVDVAAHSNPERLAELKLLLSDESVGASPAAPPNPAESAGVEWANPRPPASEPAPAAAVARTVAVATASGVSETIRDISDPRLRLLWPAPRRMVQLEGPSIVLPQVAKVSVSCPDPALAPRVEHVWDRLRADLRELNVSLVRVAATHSSATHIVLQLNPTVVPTPQMCVPHPSRGASVRDLPATA